jgi:hypothetical protein
MMAAWSAVALVSSYEFRVRTAPLRQGLYADGSVILFGNPALLRSRWLEQIERAPI